MSGRDEDYRELLKGGLTNTDVGDLRDLIGDEVEDVKVSYCTSPKCSYKSTSRKGRPVAVGHHVTSCPNCNWESYLHYGEVNSTKAAELKAKL